MQSLNATSQAPTTTCQSIPTIPTTDLVVHLDFESLGGLNLHNGANFVLGCVSIDSILRWTRCGDGPEEALFLV